MPFGGRQAGHLAKPTWRDSRLKARGHDETLGTTRGDRERVTELRDEEKVVAATITTTLGLRVEQHDDGQQPGIHDLNIISVDGSPAAVEVTFAYDPTARNSGSW